MSPPRKAHSNLDRPALRDYIADMAGELANLARATGDDPLARLLELASELAERDTGAPSRSEPSPSAYPAQTNPPGRS